MVMLTSGGGCSSTAGSPTLARVSGRSSALAGPSCSAKANMTAQTASAEAAAATARLRFRRSLCMGGGAPEPARLALTAAASRD